MPRLGRFARDGSSSAAFGHPLRQTCRPIVAKVGSIFIDPDTADPYLEIVAHCASMGFFPEHLTRTSTHNYESALSEAAAGHALFAAGFTYRGRAGGRADLRLERGPSERVTVEVYCPRQVAGLAYLDREIMETAKALDIPYDYTIGGAIRPAGGAVAAAGVRWLYGYERPGVRDALVSSLAEEMFERIPTSADSTNIRRVDDRADLRIEVDVSGIEPSQGYPSRLVVWSGSHPPHAPDLVFQRYIDSGLARKINKGQAKSDEGVPGVIVVDYSLMPLVDIEFKHPWYLREFARRLAECETLTAVDGIVFWDRTFGTVPLIFDPSAHAMVIAEALRRGPWTGLEYGPGIFIDSELADSSR
jgi:hypothetical protein